MMRAMPTTRVTTSKVSQSPNFDSRLLLIGASVVRINPLPEGTTLKADFFTDLWRASRGPFQVLAKDEEGCATANQVGQRSSQRPRPNRQHLVETLPQGGQVP